MGAEQIEDEVTDAGKALDPVAQLTEGRRAARGGTFAPADIPLIKRALHVYLIDFMRTVESERDPHPDVSSIANLLHRLGRIG